MLKYSSIISFFKRKYTFPFSILIFFGIVSIVSWFIFSEPERIIESHPFRTVEWQEDTTLGRSLFGNYEKGTIIAYPIKSVGIENARLFVNSKGWKIREEDDRKLTIYVTEFTPWTLDNVIEKLENSGYFDLVTQNRFASPD